MYYTGVGSRETPKEIMQLMCVFAKKAANLGWVLRSGGAGGADIAFQSGVSISEEPDRGDIYVPWKGFQNYQGTEPMIKIASQFENWPEAEKIAARVHPAWDKCSKGAKALHTRNVYQVLGDSLATPSKFLLCWAQVDRQGVPKGGTRTAWMLAVEHDVATYNLHDPATYDRISAWVNK